MIGVDVNVLVSALRREAVDHDDMRAWLEDTVNGAEPLALSQAVLSGTLRVLTHPHVFTPPTPVDRAVDSLTALVDHPRVSVVGPGPRYWSILTDLCRATAARGNLVADAGHAATAIEHGLTWVSKDRDFARFPGLRWQVPT